MTPEISARRQFRLSHYPPFERPDRRCPKCQHKGYMFRARKNVDLPEGKFTDTKYRCRPCAHEWWERIPAPHELKRTDGAA